MDTASARFECAHHAGMFHRPYSVILQFRSEILTAENGGPIVGKFNVQVIITAQCEYTVEVDADSEDQAEDRALKLWRDKTPEDFQVEKGYITDWETEAEQLTAECPDCNTEHAMDDSWNEDRDYCAACGAKLEELERKANG
jgi:hypothetical protein